MLKLQHTFQTTGNSDALGDKSVTVVVQVPTYQYTTGADGTVSRQTSAEFQWTSFRQTLPGASYHVSLDDSFLIGNDDTTTGLAALYHAAALNSGNIDALSVLAGVSFQSSDGQSLGQQTLDL